MDAAREPNSPPRVRQPKGELNPKATELQKGVPSVLLSLLGGEDQGEGEGAIQREATRRSRKTVTDRSRRLRKKATWAEKILWRELRNRKFVGYKFRRQHDIGSYNLDFYCATARLSIELDGREHGDPERMIRDAKRTEFLATLGIKELRFWNFSIRENLRSVLDTILRELAERGEIPVEIPNENQHRKPLLKFIGPRNVLSK